MRPLYELGNAAVVALPSPHHDAAFAQPVLRTYRREEFSLNHPSFSFLQGERHRPLYFQENIYATRYPDGPQPTLPLQSNPALALHSGDGRGPGAMPPGGQDWAPVLRLW